MTTLADIETLLRQGTCASYGRHEAAKVCDVCVRVEAACEALRILETRAIYAENVGGQLRRQLAMTPDERIAKAERDAERHLTTAREHAAQRDHATRHMMTARREREAALTSLAHVNGVAVEAQDALAELHDGARWAVRLAAHLAGELACAHCGGSERCREHSAFLRRVVPGDLVVERSTHFHPQGDRGVDHFNRIGRLLGEVTEETEPDEEGETRVERYVVIALADGTVFRWTNASFALVPEETISHLTGECFRYGTIGRVPQREGGYVTPDAWRATLAARGARA